MTEPSTQEPISGPPGTPFTGPGVYPDLPESEYHADIVPESSLSNSGAKLILDSPARFRYETDHPKERPYFDLGTAAHKRLLGTGPKVVPAERTHKDGTKTIATDWRSPSTGEMRDELRKEGTVVLLADKIDMIDAMYSALAEHPITRTLFAQGDPEVSLFWRDAETGIMLRSRLDWLTNVAGRPIIVDYKTTGESASPATFHWSARKYRFPMQDHTYREGADTLLEPDHAFVFCVQETTPPFLPVYYELSDEDRRMGADDSQFARRRFAECMTSGYWPGYPAEIHRLTLRGTY